MPFSPFTCRQRGEPDPKWLQQDRPPMKVIQTLHGPQWVEASPKLSKHEHQLFAESCARIDGLAEIVSILRETREVLAIDNARAEGGAV